MGIEIRKTFQDEFGELSTEQALKLSAQKWEKIENILRTLDIEVINSNTCAACSKFNNPLCRDDNDGSRCPMGNDSGNCCDGRWAKACESIQGAKGAAENVRMFIESKLE